MADLLRAHVLHAEWVNSSQVEERGTQYATLAVIVNQANTELDVADLLRAHVLNAQSEHTKIISMHKLRDVMVVRPDVTKHIQRQMETEKLHILIVYVRLDIG